MTPGPGARLLLRKAADDDLDSLAAYIQQDSPQAAIRFLEAAQETFGALARTPELGGSFGSRNPRFSGMRIWQVKGFQHILIFYRPVQDGVEIIRVLHGARDFPALFGNDDARPAG